VIFFDANQEFLECIYSRPKPGQLTGWCFWFATKRNEDLDLHSIHNLFLVVHSFNSSVLLQLWESSAWTQ